MSVNKIYNISEWKTVGTGSTPGSGFEIIYPKTDGNWYHKGSDGIEKIVSLSYNIGNGLTSSTASGIYNYNLSVAYDGYGITYSNGFLRLGFITASSLSQNGNATAGYILSVNSSGTPTWIANTSQGINGTLNYIPKFNSATSITNSNIYDDGTSVAIGITVSNNIGGSYPKLYVSGDVDIANKLYFTSSVNTYITALTTSKLAFYSDGLILKNSGGYVFMDIVRTDTTGSNLSVFNNLITITATGSTNFTSSVVMPTVKLFGLGTASPTHLFHIYSTQSAFKLVDFSQGLGKLLSSDATGLSSWVMPNGLGMTISGYTFSINLNANSGLTVSTGLGIKLQAISGLSLSSTGLGIDPALAGYGLAYSGGSFSVTVTGTTILIGNGLTSSGNTYSLLLDVNSGLTFSSTGRLTIGIGTGLTVSGGNLVVTATGSLSLSGLTNSFPYYNTTSTFTNSVISQVSNNILIGTTSNIGAKLYISGSFSIIGNGIINNINIGRGNSSNSLIFGQNALFNSAGSYNIAIGDNSLYNNSGTDNIAIGYSASLGITTATSSVSLGNYTIYNLNSSNVVAIGHNSGRNSGHESVFVGSNAGYGGLGNVVLGYKSGGFSASSVGSYNVFVGYKAGSSYTGSYSIFIGGYDLVTASMNSIFISDGQGNLRIYSPSTGNILIGTMSDDNSSKVQITGTTSITGNLKLINSNQGLGKLLSSDANGVSNWVMPNGLGMTISGYTFSVNLNSASGLTVSTSGLGIQLQTINGLTLSSLGMAINIGAGLTISSNNVSINNGIAGTGLTISNGVLSNIISINASASYIPYFNNFNTMTSSVISQISNNILIGTSSNNGARFQIAGSMSIISATGSAFRLVDTTEALGRILNSDSSGFATWKPYKYSGTQSFTANVGSVVSHNLNTNYYMIQMFDYSTGEEIFGSYTYRGTTQTTITLTTTVTNCGLIFIG